MKRKRILDDGNYPISVFDDDEYNDKNDDYEFDEGIDGIEEGSPEFYEMCGLLPYPVRDIEGAEYIEAHGLKIGHSSIQGHRPSNEDAHLIDCRNLGKNHTLCAVFDGHAGPEASIFLSENLIKRLLENSHWKAYDSSTTKSVELLKLALVDTFMALDKALRKSDQVVYGMDASGSTGVCTIITPTHVICASIGYEHLSSNKWGSLP
jgi:hypothetical protein